MDGLLNIQKPSGLTSFEVVRKVRRILQEKKVGHCGTLDPMAAGVLIVVFGKATKQAAQISGQDKVYRAQVRLGLSTDSGDITGKIIEESPVPDIPIEKVKTVLKNFIGLTDQIPPMVSAVKHRGRRLYALAREGITVERIPRKIEIKSIEMIQFNSPVLEFRVLCSKGTYIRVLAEDLGRALGVPATLQSLVREKSGNFRIEESLPWPQVLSSSKESLLAVGATGSVALTTIGRSPLQHIP